MKTKLYFLTACFFMLTLTTQASHIVGLRITYSHVSGNDYMFNLKFYRDCSGISAPSSVSITFQSASNPTFSAILQMDVLNSGFEVPFNSCNGVGATFCTGGSIFAFEEYNYNGVVSVPPASDWVVSYSLCCRNAAITNLVNPAQYSAYVETTFDNLNYPGNSSPEFNAVPLNYYCAGIPSIKDYSAFDLDGDSLSYEFTSIYDGPGGLSSIIPFVAPYTYDQPLATLVPTVFDPINGMIQFTPSAIQISVVGFKVNEYRNGVLIGSVRRDDEIVVVGNFSNPDTISGRVYIDLNSNGVFDVTDLPWGNEMVHMGPGNSYTSTMGNGKYEFFTSSGIFDLSIPNPPLYTTVTPALITVNTIGGGGTSYLNNDFILDPVPNQNDLQLSVNSSTSPVPGMSYPLTVNYSNAGTTTQSNVQVTVTLDPLINYVSAVPAPVNINNNVITWDFPSLNMFSTGMISIQTYVDSTAVIGTPVVVTAVISSPALDLTPSNNIDNIDTEVLASYDPNDKENDPSGDISPAFVAAQNWINYKINFQNLGTAPAQTVRILDLIDYDLDLSTIELVGSSFPCAMFLNNGFELEFKFYGINLAPASVNEAGSHGFVEYRVKPKSYLGLGSLITNNASIYFDFNPPVHTNLVHNMVVNTTSLTEVADKTNQFEVYPSPVKDELTVDFMNGTFEGEAELRVFDLPGTTVVRKNVRIQKGQNSFRLDVSKFSSGIYFVSLGSSQNEKVQKFVVIRD